MVTTEVMDVQQVTTWSKGKAAEGETQEAIQKQATKWIQQANQRNVEELKEQAKSLEETFRSMDKDRYGSIYTNVRLCCHWTVSCNWFPHLQKG